ncbi:MAG: glycosyltransferase family 2 protein [Bacteroidales bacterium]|jgi:N-acetylglucosaminyl-diphospho-decaprenol L-rhamnosyltransferase|nr:glycosyltransferase family 2 protein [Bacteroidales bacterium]
MADVLVVIVTYNALKWVGKCLRSVERSTYPADVVLIDNGSTDGTLPLVRTDFPQVRIIETGENLGFGAANNIGLRMALDEGYRFAYLLNQDAWLEKDTLERLIAAHKEELGVLSPMQLDARGRRDKRFDRKCGKYIDAALGGYHKETLVVEVPFVMAAHWLLSRKAIETVGGFSPAFRQYGEDDNWLHRLHFHKLLCGVVPAAKAVHDRAGRRPGREKKMALKCISTVVKLSDPNRPWRWMRIREVLELVGMGIKNFSAIPWRYIRELRERFPELKEYREASMRKGAFLPE